MARNDENNKTYADGGVIAGCELGSWEGAKKGCCVGKVPLTRRHEPPAKEHANITGSLEKDKIGDKNGETRESLYCIVG